uniref:RHS repeat-associated core domain-containing protein n=2 Tax=Pseudomonas syringae TaxID=317 RepID=UPI001E440E44
VLAPEKNREHSIKLQLPAWNVGFMRRLQYFDAETDLHYNRHRYYNSGTGRFLTPDPIKLAGGLNNYRYVPNPTGWVDSLGLSGVSHATVLIRKNQTNLAKWTTRVSLVWICLSGVRTLET